ncbi:CLUMA_CG001722, isoform A [Clunio marinus]|uniref:CLUMA_CG001722, isoform A n=1 Tax=Clunio marinus TaxID=568069 RepID=A0A1J1HIQ9_9DIPT|nr:CLUMA_CG001722, isoform A [Clunio marinus]
MFKPGLEVFSKLLKNSYSHIRSVSSSTASITKIHRAVYARTYPTVIVNSDGSTYRTRYHEPRAIIKLPIDISQLSDAERKIRLDKRKPKRKVKIEAEVDDKFNSSKYLKYMKKK